MKKARISLVSGRYIVLSDLTIDHLGALGFDSHNKSIFIPLAQVSQVEEL